MKRVIASFTALLVLTSILSFSVYPQIEVLEFDDEEDFEEPSTSRREDPKKQASVEIIKPKKLQAEDLIHHGDILDVNVLGSVEYDWRGEVTEEGFLTGVNFLEKSVYAVCRTEESLAKEIAEGYSKLLNNPNVVVRILDRSKRPVSALYGAVSLPQRFKLNRKVFLNELLILSGGFTERASGEIQILRQPNTNCVLPNKSGENESEDVTDVGAEFVKVKQTSELKIITIAISDLLKGKREANPQILYGDVINVLSAESAYVIGAVENPTKIPIRTGTTVSRAIFSAGGLTKDANSKRITIFRREDQDTQIIKVDLDKIKLKEEKDLVLKPFDVVQVGGRSNENDREPPIIRFESENKKEVEKLPLRVID